MGILDLAEEAAGAFAADKALEAVDPNAGFLGKAAAAVAGFEGVAKVKEMVSDHEQAADHTADQAPPQGDDQS
jgi:hypothetical protein